MSLVVAFIATATVIFAVIFLLSLVNDGVSDTLTLGIRLAALGMTIWGTAALIQQLLMS